MEREFVVRVDGEQRYILQRKETVLNTEVEAYTFVGSRRKATAFRGPPEEDAALLERISLYLGRWKRDLVIDELPRLAPQAPYIFLVRVAHTVRRNPMWKPGSWVRIVHSTLAGPHFDPCTMSEAQIFTSRRIANAAVLENERNYNVRFEVVPFAEVIKNEVERGP